MASTSSASTEKRSSATCFAGSFRNSATAPTSANVRQRKSSLNLRRSANDGLRLPRSQTLNERAVRDAFLHRKRRRLMLLALLEYWVKRLQWDVDVLLGLNTEVWEDLAKTGENVLPTADPQITTSR